MSSETGVRTILARPDGGVSVLAASAKRQGVASRDALLSRAEAKAQVGTIVGRVKVGEGLPETRTLRNAWRVNPLSGRVVVDLVAARKLRARQWVREGAELRKFIRDELLPYASIMGEDAARLDAAMVQIDRTLADLGKHIHVMTEAELASHVPAWPQLGVNREPI